MSVDKTTSMSFGGMFSKAPNLLGCQVYYTNLKTPKAYSRLCNNMRSLFREIGRLKHVFIAIFRCTAILTK